MAKARARDAVATEATSLLGRAYAWVLGAFGDKEDQAREAARERILAGLGKHTGAEIGLSAHHMGSGGKVFLFGAVRKEAAHVRARARTQPTASGQRAGSASS